MCPICYELCKLVFTLNDVKKISIRNVFQTLEINAQIVEQVCFN